MRVPKVETFKNNEKISYVKYEKPVSISRLPVITNEKQRDKLIKQIEKYIRSSLEYKDLINYLKEYMDMNQCEFFHNVSGKTKKGMIQIHHEPYDLYTITSILPSAVFLEAFKAWVKVLGSFTFHKIYASKIIVFLSEVITSDLGKS